MVKTIQQPGNYGLNEAILSKKFITEADTYKYLINDTVCVTIAITIERKPRNEYSLNNCLH